MIVKSILGEDFTQKILRNRPDNFKSTERQTIDTFIEKLNEIVRNLKLRGADSLILNNLVKQVYLYFL